MKELAYALDATLLMEAAGMTPDDWQAEALRSDQTRRLLLCCRQSGKSTVAAALAVQKALATEESLSLLLAPSQRQSRELFGKVASLWRAAGEPGGEAEKISTSALTLQNGSRIKALPGTERTTRGFSGVDLLVIDEAARVPGSLYYAVRPMLAVSGGELMVLSTPWGRRGWFFEEWTENRSAWDAYRIDAHQCPRITDDFLEEERRRLPAQWFESEYLCRFTDTATSAFDSRDVSAMGQPGVPMLFDQEAVPDLSEDVPLMLLADAQKN